ncbi:MAG: hypothetical protein GC165_16435 [Armatimonadetes bacterium]|nr:hypothetical protein [Armatimonadota bacterium]MBS1725281.1 hypothetical protein [Armatimonadota bacterium]
MSENTSYDPTAPEGESSPGGQYLTKKDAKWIILAAVGFFVVMIPIYLTMREKAYRATCVRNMNGIMEAMILYSTEHDDRFPPLYNTNDKGEPDADSSGYAYTWVSDVWPLRAPRINFVCPTATPEELAYSANPTGGDPIPSSYGFYAPYASYSTQLVDHPETVVILAETSNAGTRDTYDPLPFKTSKYDGFVINWDTGNDWPDQQTRFVTRLAFPGSKGGNPGKAEARHGQYINAIAASRSKTFLSPDSMLTDYNPAKYTLSGHWQEPVQRKGN